MREQRGDVAASVHHGELGRFHARGGVVPAADRQVRGIHTVADEMRAQLSGATRIVSLSLKDYTATSMAGSRADAVVWMSVSNMSFMSSSV